jgi:AcrR family transcriptional regulator
MTRPAEITRRALIDAATAVFADQGYEGGSVRAITQKAKANQAAITYHFGGKEGLYRAVLQAALHAFDEANFIDEAKLPDMDREEALGLFLRQQLLPLLRRNQFTRYLRIFNWEILQRSSVFQELVATEHLPTVAVAQGIVDKFLPETATPEDRILAVIWLVNQAFIFVRNAEHLAKPPTNIKVDEAFVERLIETLTRLLGSGLSGLALLQPRS